MSTLAPVLAAAAAVAGGATDARTGLIPDALTAPAFVLVTMAAAGAGDLGGAWRGALAFGGVLLLLHAITLGRGIGLGDVKLGAAAGAGLGPAAALAALTVAFAAGGAYAAWLLATRRAHRGDAVRFGPFIAAGAVAALAWNLVR